MKQLARIRNLSDAIWPLSLPQSPFVPSLPPSNNHHDPSKWRAFLLSFGPLSGASNGGRSATTAGIKSCLGNCPNPTQQLSLYETVLLSQ